ncbi:serine hydrolase [Porticoccus sp. W117]|uniref:serine hydrolase domain-containing protein n=1 Tax=Porticoccus sp. W117 TaxID=3054777 RepID=UPI00259A3C47|nr:serine hydrolase [Porticoccus sp. W117]MDM3870802.1 serine hydrolase [Porticoccus sp. W117]
MSDQSPESSTNDDQQAAKAPQNDVVWQPTAEEMGFLQTSDVEPNNRVHLGNWTEGAPVRWSFQNACQIVPSAEIYRGSGKPTVFKEIPTELNHIEFTTYDGDDMTVEQMLAQTYTDGLLVLHQGKLVNEQYFNGLQPHSKHLMQSVTKSLVGTLACILMEQKRLNPDKLVEDYVPELAHSGYGDATVRQVLDMTTSILYQENYGVVSELTMHEASAGWRPRTGQLEGLPEAQALFLQSLRKEPGRKHGGRFAYISCNTDVLGWIMERATGERLPQLFSDLIWSHLGAEENCHMLVDSWGLSAASGGMNATMRDLGRFGQMLLQGGTYNGHQFLSETTIKDIRTNGSRNLWKRGEGSGIGYLMPKGSYRNQWWVTDFDSKAFYAIGIHGQHIYIAPEAEVVIVKVSSQPNAITPEYTQNSLYGFEAIVKHLATKGTGLFK